MLLLRGQLLGRVADYARADRAGERGGGERAPLGGGAPAAGVGERHAPSVPRRRGGARPGRVARGERAGFAAARAAILESTGRAAEALPQRQRDAAARPDLATRVALAVVEAELGDTPAALRLFALAQDGYRGASPFPLAFLYLQEGLVAERAGRLGRARDLFSAALDRVPGFAPAALHLAGVLAGMGRRRLAMDALEPLRHSADDPEVLGQHRGLYRSEGRAAEAEGLFRRAGTDYERLLATMPEAFSDHGARLYQAWGGDAARALALARAEPRKPAHARGLRAGDRHRPRGGRATVRVPAGRSPRRRGRPQTPLTQLAAARALAACGRAAEARALLAQAESALSPPPSAEP